MWRLNDPILCLSARLQGRVNIILFIKILRKLWSTYLNFSRAVANTKLARSPLLVLLHFISVGDWRLSLQCDICGFTFAASGKLLWNNKKAMVWGFLISVKSFNWITWAILSAIGLALFKSPATCEIKLVNDCQQSGAMWERTGG